MARRQFLTQLIGLPFLASGRASAQEAKKPLKIMMKSAWGPDDPTRAAFPFAHGLVLAEAGHEVQIFLLAEATSLDAKVDGERDSAGWLAAAERNARQGRGKTHSDLCLRSLLPGPWGHGNRLESMGSKIWESGDLCLARAVGGPDNCRVKMGQYVAGGSRNRKPGKSTLLVTAALIRL